MYPQGTQSGYPTVQYPYSTPAYYYGTQQSVAWQQTNTLAQEWQPVQQSWCGAPSSSQEPPPPGTGDDPAPPGEESNPPPAPAAVSAPHVPWQANYWQQWQTQGWTTGVDQWNGQWPTQPGYPYNYQGYSHPTLSVGVSHADQTPPSQQQEATPPPPGVIEEGCVHQPRIQQYSQAGYTTELPPSQPDPARETSGGLLPVPGQFVQQQEGSERRSEDQPPVRKRQSRWEQRPCDTGATHPLPPNSSETSEKTPQKKPAAPLTPDQWPPKLRDYIDRAFAACEGRPADLERVQQFLKEELNDIFRQNQVWEVDWDTKPLPLDQQPPSLRASRWDTPSPTLSDSRYHPATPTVGGVGRGRRRKGAMKKKRGGRMFFIDKSGDGLSAVEQQRLDKRALRFADGNRTYKKKLSVAELVAAATVGSREEGDLNWEEFSIEGTSQALEKPYLRLTSAPDPSAVRSLSVLRRSLVHVISKWRQNGDYRYTCEQFKSIRQDLTIQGIRNDFAVEVYESHARIALENGDRGEFNQCQAQLKALYLEGVPGQEAEFVAYRILYLILTLNSADMSTELRDLTSDLKTHPYVAHALKLWSSWQLGNYCQFFRLSNSAPGSGRSLLQLFLARERLSALRIMLKAFRPSLSVSHLSHTLSFSSEECMAWLAELELPATTSDQLNCKTCLALLQSKATTT